VVLVLVLRHDYKRISIRHDGNLILAGAFDWQAFCELGYPEVLVAYTVERILGSKRISTGEL
jgi:hypothetical protein